MPINTPSSNHFASSAREASRAGLVALAKRHPSGEACFLRGLLCLILWAGAWPAFGHDVWVSTPPAVETGQLVNVRLLQGHSGDLEPVGRNPRRLERLEALPLDGGTMPIPGIDGADPAGYFRPPAPGPWIVVYEGRPAPHNLGAEAFERHLRHEGLEWVIEERQRLGQSKSAGAELYSRHLKALLPVYDPSAPGTSGASGKAGVDPPPALPSQDRILGLAAEIFLESISHSDGIVVQVLLGGRPVAGALVDLQPSEPRGVDLGASSSSDQQGGESLAVRTDAEGRAHFPADEIPSVRSLVATAVVVGAPAMAKSEEPAPWRSYFLALTFSTGLMDSASD